MPPHRFALPFVCVLASIIFLPGTLCAQSEVPGVGTWKLNVKKSKLGDEKPPQSLTSTIEAVDGHARVIGVRIDSDGIRTESRFKAKLDGKDYPIVGHSYADTIALKRIDARTIERVDKKAGKIVETSLTVYSEDGKSSTTTGKASNYRGENFLYIVVNEKMP